MHYADTITDIINAGRVDRTIARLNHVREVGECDDPLCCICVPDPAGDDAYAAEYAEYLTKHTADMGEADPASELCLADYAASREWETAPRPATTPADVIDDADLPW